MFELVEHIRQHRRAVPSQRRRGRPAGTAGHPERPADGPGAAYHPRLRLFLASRQHRRGPAPHPPHPRLRHRQLRRRAQGTMAHALDRARERRHSRATQLQAFFADALVQPGPDRASDRGAAQEHDRPRDGDRRAARRARPRRVHAGGAGGQRRGAAPRRADPVADQPAARHAAAASSTRWPTVSPITTIRSCASCRASMPRSRIASAPSTRPGSGARRCLLPAHGQLDRRRPRRQSLRHGRRDCARRCGCKASGRCASISTSCTCWAPSCRSMAGSCGVSDALAALAERSPDQSSERRTSPTGAPSPASMRGWRRPRGRSISSKRRTRRSGDGAAYDDGGRPGSRSRDAPPLAGRQRLRHPGARAPEVLAPRRRRLRLPSCGARSAPELRRARAHRRRAARDRRHRAPTMRRWPRTARASCCWRRWQRRGR